MDKNGVGASLGLLLILLVLFIGFGVISDSDNQSASRAQRLTEIAGVTATPAAGKPDFRTPPPGLEVTLTTMWRNLETTPYYTATNPFPTETPPPPPTATQVAVRTLAPLATQRPEVSNLPKRAEEQPEILAAFRLPSWGWALIVWGIVAIVMTAILFIFPPREIQDWGCFGRGAALVAFWTAAFFGWGAGLIAALIFAIVLGYLVAGNRAR